MKQLEKLRPAVDLPLFIARELPGTVIGLVRDIIQILQNRIDILRHGRGGPLTTDTFMADKGQPYHLK